MAISRYGVKAKPTVSLLTPPNLRFGAIFEKLCTKSQIWLLSGCKTVKLRYSAHGICAVVMRKQNKIKALQANDSQQQFIEISRSSNLMQPDPKLDLASNSKQMTELNKLKNQSLWLLKTFGLLKINWTKKSPHGSPFEISKSRAGLSCSTLLKKNEQS